VWHYSEPTVYIFSHLASSNRNWRASYTWNQGTNVSQANQSYSICLSRSKHDLYTSHCLRDPKITWACRSNLTHNFCNQSNCHRTTVQTYFKAMYDWVSCETQSRPVKGIASNFISISTAAQPAIAFCSQQRWIFDETFWTVPCGEMFRKRWVVLFVKKKMMMIMRKLVEKSSVALLFNNARVWFWTFF
jgi:hypothetical protein